MNFSQLVICMLSNGRIAISTDFNLLQFLIVNDSTLGEDIYTFSIELLSKMVTLVNEGQSNILSVFNDWLVASILRLRKFKQLFILRICNALQLVTSSSVMKFWLDNFNVTILEFAILKSLIEIFSGNIRPVIQLLFTYNVCNLSNPFCRLSTYWLTPGAGYVFLKSMFLISDLYIGLPSSSKPIVLQNLLLI